MIYFLVFSKQLSMYNLLNKFYFLFQEFKACASNPCVNGNCFYKNNTYVCSCLPGYTGKNCGISNLKYIFKISTLEYIFKKFYPI